MTLPGTYAWGPVITWGKPAFGIVWGHPSVSVSSLWCYHPSGIFLLDSLGCIFATPPACFFFLFVFCFAFCCFWVFFLTISAFFAFSGCFRGLFVLLWVVFETHFSLFEPLSRLLCAFLLAYCFAFCSLPFCSHYYIVRLI